MYLVMVRLSSEWLHHLCSLHAASSSSFPHLVVSVSSIWWSAAPEDTAPAAGTRHLQPRLSTTLHLHACETRQGHCCYKSKSGRVSTGRGTWRSCDTPMNLCCYCDVRTPTWLQVGTLVACGDRLDLSCASKHMREKDTLLRPARLAIDLELDQ